MMTLSVIAANFSLGLVSTAMATSSLISIPVSDLALDNQSLGAKQVTMINHKSGELTQSLSFKPLRPSIATRSKPVVASQTATKNSPPESPYETYFTQYASQFGVDVNLLKKIAWCESHYNYDSVSKSGTYGGMFQFSASTWSSTRQAMGADPNPELRFDPKEAILTAAYKIAAGGVRAWPVCSTR